MKLSQKELAKAYIELCSKAHWSKKQVKITMDELKNILSDGKCFYTNDNCDEYNFSIFLINKNEDFTYDNIAICNKDIMDILEYIKKSGVEHKRLNKLFNKLLNGI